MKWQPHHDMIYSCKIFSQFFVRIEQIHSIGWFMTVFAPPPRNRSVGGGERTRGYIQGVPKKRNDNFLTIKRSNVDDLNFL